MSKQRKLKRAEAVKMEQPVPVKTVEEECSEKVNAILREYDCGLEVTMLVTEAGNRQSVSVVKNHIHEEAIEPHIHE